MRLTIGQEPPPFLLNFLHRVEKKYIMVLIADTAILIVLLILPAADYKLGGMIGHIQNFSIISVLWQNDRTIHLEVVYEVWDLN